MHAQPERPAPPPSFPDPFPAWWAGEWGEDEHGLWVALIFRDVRQVFRWIEPGTFLMGSPETEPERGDDEIQHQVTLTRGYWLADSACTQGLWQAVMAGNPSRFKGDPDLPVENVSWNDVQGFLVSLNGKVPDLDARLPTEAEWEYACRAGTGTPFSFGENITPEQVNYRGSAPYAGGTEGLYRQKTVPVKSLPPNPRGLYQLHGNVWEWCRDGYGPYPAESVVDPEGPTEGALRVLRGGSWFNYGGHARSPFRFLYEPDSRGVDFGFRLALGHTGSGGPAEPKS